MDESFKPARLAEWSLATFHTSGLIVVVVALVYATGNLGALLGSLNTLVGLALFGALWLTTWWCTRRAVRAIPPQTLAQPRSSGRAVVRSLAIGGLWGGVNGAVFFLVLVSGLLVVSIYEVVTVANTSLVFLALAGLFGVPIAFGVGAVIGILFAGIDGAVLELARVLTSFTARERE
jgi:hypothetical protein